MAGERKLLGITVANITIRTAEKGGDDKGVDKFVPTLLTLRDGAKKFTRVARGKPSVSKLQTKGLFLLDTGFELFIWKGKAAPQSSRVSAFPCAQKYLHDYRRPPVLPIHTYTEGKEPQRFLGFFGPAEKPACCVIS